MQKDVFQNAKRCFSKCKKMFFKMQKDVYKNAEKDVFFFKMHKKDVFQNANFWI